MGCDGYAEFKLRMKEYAGQKQVEGFPEDISEIKVFFERLETMAFQRKLEEASAVIARAERIVFIEWEIPGILVSMEPDILQILENSVCLYLIHFTRLIWLTPCRLLLLSYLFLGNQSSL